MLSVSKHKSMTMNVKLNLSVSPTEGMCIKMNMSMNVLEFFYEFG